MFDGAAILSNGPMGSEGGLSTGAVVAIVAAVAAVAAGVAHNVRSKAASARVHVRTQADPGVFQLDQFPAPGAAPSVALGVRLNADPGGVQSISEVAT